MFGNYFLETIENSGLAVVDISKNAKMVQYISPKEKFDVGIYDVDKNTFYPNYTDFKNGSFHACTVSYAEACAALCDVNVSSPGAL